MAVAVQADMCLIVVMTDTALAQENARLKARLAETEAALADAVARGPDPERDGVSAWTRADLCRWLEAEFSKTYHPASMGRVLRGLNMSRQKIRPAHPEKDPEAEESFKKGGSATA